MASMPNANGRQPQTPSLNACIDSMKSLGKNASSPSMTNQSEFNLAMIGFMWQVCQDIDVLSTVLRSNGVACIDEVPFSKVPAITELVTDPELFKCIISMLSPPGGSCFQPNSQLSSSSNSLPPKSQGRKRSPSEDATNHPARKKLLLSPTPGSRMHPKQQAQIHPPGSGTMSIGGESQTSQPIANRFPVAAATILFSALQHVDHWPVLLMQAFAEDCFGPRNWVDDDRCKSIVSNLELSLDPSKYIGFSVLSFTSNAEDVESYFSSLILRTDTDDSIPKQESSSCPSSPNKIPTPKNNDASMPSTQRMVPSAKEACEPAGNSEQSVNSDSSSSGEEEVLESESNSVALDSKLNETSTSQKDEEMNNDILPFASQRNNSSTSHALHILFQGYDLGKERVRPRYNGPTLELAYEAISDALRDRLNSKTKQNSRLLQTLPCFLCIPRVRSLASRHLERWLQSPALAGLARTLFTEIVVQMKNVDPPFPDDEEAIDNILKMNLKANQFAAHVENITLIAKTIPTLTVFTKIFVHCLKGTSSDRSISGALELSKDHMRILYSVYSLDPSLSAYSLAASVFTLTSDILEAQSEPDNINIQLKHVRYLLSTVASNLNHVFDGFLFAEAVIKTFTGKSENMRAIDITSRLIFECIVLVSTPLLNNPLQFGESKTITSKYPESCVEEESLNYFRKKMLALRKIILQWCLSDMYPLYHNEVSREKHNESSDVFDERGAVTRGPGIPDYESVIDGSLSYDKGNERSPFENLMSFIRCLLFIPHPSSNELRTFCNPIASANEELDKDHHQRINLCFQYGSDVDDEILHIVLKASFIDQYTAVSILENLVLGCGKGNTSNVVACSSATIWEMYNLAEYKPKLKNVNNELTPNGQENSDVMDLKMKAKDGEGFTEKESSIRALPRLAYPSLWWRITSIALAMCSISPKDVGRAMWSHHPTLRSLIKMTTSQKYRFPTADCDDIEREQVKLAEEATKQEEARIAELLFMPARPKLVNKDKENISRLQSNRGLRFSARQREKQEKLIAQEQERKAAAIHAENMKLKKLLRSFQKSIMLWNPKQSQRKPPKGSIDLLLAVNDLFNLAEKFRLCTEPDFLLQTIGEGRCAIERAYDWLIPIISSHPKPIIDRLQPSASCFLLLRAYGAECDSNKDELLTLSAPLLSHVSNCLRGEYGEQHAVLAMELLLQDIADECPDRRRCSRKVLQEAIGGEKGHNSQRFGYDVGLCGWLLQLVHLKFSKSLISLVIKYVSHALAFERGRVLAVYVMALSEYKTFEEKNSIEGSFDFVSSLCELISVRPHVCSDAMDRFPFLRALALATVKRSFDQAVSSNNLESIPTEQSSIIFSLPSDLNDDNQNGIRSGEIPSHLMQAAIILVSNWQSTDCDESRSDSIDPLEKNNEISIRSLLNYLVVPFTVGDINGEKGETTSGAASARYKQDGKRAVSVEEWVLLGKARSDFVAKYAALSAPDNFLPRLLLCCGLSNTSFLTMLRRLSKLGDSLATPENVFEGLLSPAAVSEWGLPRMGGRRVIKRKLYGRISAYLRKNRTDLNTVTKSSFVSWLTVECRKMSNSKGQTEKVSKQVQKCLAQPPFGDVCSDLIIDGMVDESFSMKRTREDSVALCIDQSRNTSKDYIQRCIANEEYGSLEEFLGSIEKSTIDNRNGGISAAKELLKSFSSLFSHPPTLVHLLLKWFPPLTQLRGDQELWRRIFHYTKDYSPNPFYFDAIMSLVCKCAMTWSSEHVTNCQSWILSCQPPKNTDSLKFLLRFLIVSSEQESVNLCQQNDFDFSLRFACVQSEDSAISAIKLAFSYVELENGTHLEKKSEKAGTSFFGRNFVPDWALLLFLVARSGESNLNLIIRQSTECVLRNPTSTLELSAFLLRFYVASPLQVKLDDFSLQNLLLQASNRNWPLWMDWKCPLDIQMSEMLSNLVISPHQRLFQSIIDLAKQHPLLMIRHFNLLWHKLLQDGSGVDGNYQNFMKRGRTTGRSIEGDAFAKLGDNEVRVTVVLWGFSFNESVWIYVLDLISSLPQEVAFTCGLKSGLEGILEIYLKLLVTQIMVLESAKNVQHIQEKFAILLNSFKNCQNDVFQIWLEKDIIGWGSIIELMSKGGVSHTLENVS